MTGEKTRFLNPGGVYESAVGRTHVSNRHSVAVDNKLAVSSGNAGIFEPEIIADAAPEKVNSRLELDLPGLRCPWLNDKSRHRLTSE